MKPGESCDSFVSSRKTVPMMATSRHGEKSRLYRSGLPGVVWSKILDRTCGQSQRFMTEPFHTGFGTATCIGCFDATLYWFRGGWQAESDKNIYKTRTRWINTSHAFCCHFRWGRTGLHDCSWKLDRNLGIWLDRVLFSSWSWTELPVQILDFGSVMTFRCHPNSLRAVELFVALIVPLTDRYHKTQVWTALRNTFMGPTYARMRPTALFIAAF